MSCSVYSTVESQTLYAYSAATDYNPLAPPTTSEYNSNVLSVKNHILLGISAQETGQTVALAAGQNWFSSSVEITLEDLQTALTDVLGTNASITIQSQTESCTLKRNNWTGTLTTMDLSQMYMIEVATDCEISLQGSPVNPAAHPVTISFGENWIAFPLNVAMSLDEAFAGFAQNDDAVSSQTQNASRKRNKWTGTLTELQPGQGFIYTSSVNGDRTLVFPTGKGITNNGGKK
jgi:hypothetical protein